MTEQDVTEKGEASTSETTSQVETVPAEGSPGKRATKRESTTLTQALSTIQSGAIRTDIPNFGVGDTVRVHAKIVEGNKERVQVFEGVILKRNKGNQVDATFTVRKVSYNIGVERTFPLHSPRIETIELVSRAKVRRSRLFYLRPLRGKSTRMKTRFETRDAAAEGSSNQAA